MTRVIHTGDTHVGYQQYHSPERRADFRRAFDAVVDDAIEEGVDAVVHAGDLFHDRRPELPDLMAVLSALRRLADADIPFLAVVGNHEATRTGEWLDLFEGTGLATRLDDTPEVVGDTAFYGLDWVPESRRDDLDYEFADHDVDHAALVSHGLFTPFEFGEWDTETVLAEATVEFDAVLLGDNHKPDTAEVSGTWVTYCGSTERASASEEDARGYNLVTFDGEVDIRRRSLDTRPFAFVSVDLAEGEGVERVREQVRQHDLADAVCIVEITGEGEPVTPAAIEEAGEAEGALLVRVTDRREIEEEAEIGVSFADPDDAVNERVSEMGLSTAARGVDETVRESKVADSNVRGEVKNRVSELLDEEPDAFESAAGDEADDPADDSSDTDDPPDESTDDSSEEPSAAATKGEEAADEPTAESEKQGTMEEYL
ncbi:MULTISPECIES: DNA double-strand break repair protein Mre11 [Halolamina]|uniref:DNA double-strand break repair protein Mre11 n=1 Tax=Halolamina pelagica TaxID=699431 RepID=A0A1I5R4B7_9EURY|nr:MULTISPECIES: DNA double-strand break repair protein Mre11 [Halolamina]NHX35675.1 exonuclease SbcCD subunit D [Halolamina sp. R1-12]SFP53187.1 DNA repair exonuclease SbcCD nuclease subunit [Halolamina pelagica]